MLVQLSPYPGHQAKPLLTQSADFLDLARMLVSNALKHIQLVVHHPHVGHWYSAGIHHLHIAVQRFAGEHNALICFGWGHGGTIDHG